MTIQRHPTSYVRTAIVTDPDTGGQVEVEIRKDAVTGAMVGIDGSHLEHDMGPVRSPYDRNTILVVPDNEIGLSKYYLNRHENHG